MLDEALPVPLGAIHRFEEVNQLLVYVNEWIELPEEEGSDSAALVRACRLPPEDRNYERSVSLLLFEGHYVLVKGCSKLLRSNEGGRVHIGCGHANYAFRPRCCRRFSEKAFERHQLYKR